MDRKGCTKVIYKGTFISDQSLHPAITIHMVFASKIVPVYIHCSNDQKKKSRSLDQLFHPLGSEQFSKQNTTLYASRF